MSEQRTPLKLEDDGRWYVDGSVLLDGDHVEAYFPAVNEWDQGCIRWLQLTGEYCVYFEFGELAGNWVPVQNFKLLRRPGAQVSEIPLPDDDGPTPPNTSGDDEIPF